MRNNFLLLVTILFYNIFFAQIIPQGARHLKTTEATVYNKKNTVEYKVSYTYYDSLWRELSSTNSVPSKSELNAVKILDTPLKKITAYIKENGDTLDFRVLIYDDKGNRTHNFQIRNGDTIVAQKRVYDENGQNIELYNKEDGKYFLRMKWKYNDNDKEIYCETFNIKGNTVKIEEYERSQDEKEVKCYNYDKYGNKILKTKTIKLNENESQIFYYYDTEGWNYGINLIHEKGGYEIIEKTKNDNLKKLEIYNKKKKMTTSIYVKYTDI